MEHHVACNWRASPNLSQKYGFWCDCGVCNPMTSHTVIGVLQLLCYLSGTEVHDMPFVEMENINDHHIIRLMDGTVDLREVS